MNTVQYWQYGYNKNSDNIFPSNEFDAPIDQTKFYVITFKLYGFYDIFMYPETSIGANDYKPAKIVNKPGNLDIHNTTLQINSGYRVNGTGHMSQSLKSFNKPGEFYHNNFLQNYYNGKNTIAWTLPPDENNPSGDLTIKFLVSKDLCDTTLLAQDLGKIDLIIHFEKPIDYEYVPTMLGDNPHPYPKSFNINSRQKELAESENNIAILQFSHLIFNDNKAVRLRWSGKEMTDKLKYKESGIFKNLTIHDLIDKPGLRNYNLITLQ